KRRHGTEPPLCAKRVARYIPTQARSFRWLLGLCAPRRGPFLLCQPTGISPSVGVRLSSFADGVSRSRVASVAPRQLLVAFARARLGLAQRRRKPLAVQRRHHVAFQNPLSTRKPSWPAGEGELLPQLPLRGGKPFRRRRTTDPDIKLSGRNDG